MGAQAPPGHGCHDKAGLVPIPLLQVLQAKQALMAATTRAHNQALPAVPAGMWGSGGSAAPGQPWLPWQRLQELWGPQNTSTCLLGARLGEEQGSCQQQMKPHETPHHPCPGLAARGVGKECRVTALPGLEPLQGKTAPPTCYPSCWRTLRIVGLSPRNFSET